MDGWMDGCGLDR